MSMVVQTQRRWGAACMLAIALLAGSICGPTCAGALCPTRSVARAAKANCHGMAAHRGELVSACSRLPSCNLGDANMAMPLKPGLANVNANTHGSWLLFLICLPHSEPSKVCMGRRSVHRPELPNDFHTVLTALGLPLATQSVLRNIANGGLT